MTKKSILITGCSGYIGQHLQKMLANFDYNVYGIDIKPNPLDDETINLNIRHDLPDWMLSFYDAPDYFDTVIHLAALVRVNESVEKPWLYYDTNVNGTKNILEQIKFKNFIFASTGAAEYCASPYALSKRVTEDIVVEYCQKNNCQYTTYRFYNVIGSEGIAPTNPDGLFHGLIQARSTGVFNLYGDDWNTPDGSCLRDYVHVNEICHAIISAIETPANKVENLGHGIGTSVKEMVSIFKQVNNCDFEINVLPRRPGDVQCSVLKEVSPYMKTIYSIEELLHHGKI